MKSITFASLALVGCLAAAFVVGVSKHDVDAAPPDTCDYVGTAGVDCPPSGSNVGPRHVGTWWRIKEIHGTKLHEGRGPPQILIGDDRVGVATGCRSFSAFILDKTKTPRFEIVSAPLIAIACADVLEGQEIALGTLFAAATHVEVDDGVSLTIRTPDGGELVAVPWREDHNPDINPDPT